MRQILIDIDAHAHSSKRVRVDVCVWEPERHGKSTMKSAYRQLYDEQCRRLEENQASSSVDINWSRNRKLMFLRVFGYSSGEWS